MKNISINIIFLTMVLSALSAQDHNSPLIKFIDKGRYLILKLPYEIDTNCKTVFEEDSPLAIDIIEIIADGETLTYIEDIRPFNARTYWNVHPITAGQKKYYISMYWKKYSSKSLRWNDGRGIIFTEIEPGVFHMSTNSYELLKSMQHVEIKYRIRLPDKLMPQKVIEPYEFQDNRYSEIYTIRVDFNNIWEN